MRKMFWFFSIVIFGVLFTACGDDDRNLEIQAVRQNIPDPDRLIPEMNSTIGGFVWFDEDGDGIYSGGEKKLEGVTVYLLDDSYYESLPSEILWNNKKVTDSTGAYTFNQHLLDGNEFFIVFVHPDGYTFTKKDAGQNAVDSDPFQDGFTEIFEAHPGENLIWSAGLIPASPISTPDTSISTDDGAGDCVDINTNAESDCNADFVHFEIGFDAIAREIALIFGFHQPTDLSTLEMCGGFNMDGNGNTGTDETLLDGVEILVCYSGFDEVGYIVRYNPDGSFVGSEDLSAEQVRLITDLGPAGVESVKLIVQRDVLGGPEGIDEDASVMANIMLPPVLVDGGESVQLPEGIAGGSTP